MDTLKVLWHINGDDAPPVECNLTGLARPPEGEYTTDGTILSFDLAGGFDATTRAPIDAVRSYFQKAAAEGKTPVWSTSVRRRLEQETGTAAFPAPNL